MITLLFLALLYAFAGLVLTAVTAVFLRTKIKGYRVEAIEVVTAFIFWPIVALILIVWVVAEVIAYLANAFADALP